MITPVFQYSEGNVPLLISMPHNGTELPGDIAASMTESGISVPDTDWCIDQLYDFANALGVYVIKPVYNRLVIDLNRDPTGTNLYPGAQSTELCPTTCFDFSPVYQPGRQPDNEEIRRRIEHYWRPYHQQLESGLADIREQYGIALLLDAHSIRSEVARFFEGRLPDFNFGTASGHSCSVQLQEHLKQFDTAPYSQVSNGRFKGGYITRAYGNPESNIHAVQLELSQRTYMDEINANYEEQLAAQVKPVLRRFVEHLIAFAQRPQGQD
ncbi:N-formylglutamate deformylase [Motiliproteus sp. MSK22-1]|uniref:N-formylglutamate deformylase n=1 Tax=Motiliproteus sp. MSK22-1 TaxID=1897630 RepID=UPI0009773B91|nr:N-formylglutamate deformylase [Motiliproteus sp. MSK22-1]OMH32785.1 N-formylglutamate deformylase [Motiliproteus sp. MSK22-1]